MLIEKDYCDYETCVALKELGFNEYCRGYFDPLCKIFNETRHLKGWNNTKGLDYRVLSCPNLYEAQKWLREEKKVIIVIIPYTYNIITETSTWTYEIWLEDNLEREVHDFNTYEDALSEGIKGAVKILKEK